MKNASYLSYKQFELDNGLRVVMSRDTSAPVVAVLLMYDVGSRNEPVGKTGFAHLFEHLMFQGSENVPREMHFKHVESNGGVLNGFTSQDCTCYFELLPSSKLSLGLWLEADRMRALNVNQFNLDNQRDVVKEERRMGYDNQPYALARERFRELAYDNFANQHSVIGSMEDLDGANLEDVQRFFQTYYAPNNAVLVIVGDFDERRAKPMVRELFGTIPAQPPPSAPDVAEPDRQKEHREVYHDPLASVPALMIAWKIPDRRSPKNTALQIAGDALFGGRASRMYQRLVKQEAVAVNVSGGAEARRGPGLFQVSVLHNPDVEPERVEQLIYEEMERLAEKGLSRSELERIRIQLIAQRWAGGSYSSLESPLGRALSLAQAAMFDGDPEEANREIDHLMKVRSADVKRAVQNHLVSNKNRTVMVVRAGAAQ